MNEIRAPATSSRKTVEIDCSVTLRSTDLITKRLVFNGASASNVVFDGNGAQIGTGIKDDINYNVEMIQVKSRKNNNTWERPQHVTIKNCEIFGSIRIYGMGRNGEAADVRASSRQDRQNTQHVARVRNAAPRFITLDNLTITGLGRNTVYFSPGVTFCRLINSDVKGKSSKVGIYLDAESGYNLIKNNDLHVETAEDNWGELPGVTNRGWPQMAIDGSSNNKIINNRFSAINNGGIYFYRNCGEGGTIRVTPPEKNILINNSFYYKKYKGSKPAIYLSSRDYGWKESTFGHCDAEDGWPYGSSKSNKDFARYNVIGQNQFFKRKVYRRMNNQTYLVDATLGDMIRTKNPSLNSPNYLFENELVSRRQNRKAGCYLENGYKPFLHDGEHSDLLIINGQLVCSPIRYTCSDGDIKTEANDCTLQVIPFSCQVEGSNRGCRRTVSCPRDTKLVGVKVACNLEFGEVTDGTLDRMKINEISVTRPSDDKSDGHCYFGDDLIRSGTLTMTDIFDQVRIQTGCKEKDKNGGDCHIKGQLYCVSN